MSPKNVTFPVKQIVTDDNYGILVGRLPADMAQSLEAETAFPHRHDCHFFALHESGVIQMEIDFVKYQTDSPSLFYVHPNQVHRAFKPNEEVNMFILAIGNEHIHPEYLQLLEGITPAKPLKLDEKELEVIRQTVSLCLIFSERKKDRLYCSRLRDCCNTLIALVISYYLGQPDTAEQYSRFYQVTKAFKSSLETNFIRTKRPADYANALHISLTYLNECIKNVTGTSVSQQIQERVVLEAYDWISETE